jgi:hypothetical protein
MLLASPREEVAMAMLSVVTFRTKPGRMSEVVSELKALREIENRVATNFRGMRFFEKRIGGPNSEQLVIIFEYDDLASWGATLDAELRDEAFQKMISDDPDELIDHSLYVEIPL